MAVYTKSGAFVEAYIRRTRPTSGWLGKMAVKLREFGSLTENQIAASLKAIDDLEDAAAAAYVSYAAGVKAQASAPEPVQASESALRPGVYTIEFDSGRWVTLRVLKSYNPRYPEPKLDLLTGPDNEVSFTSLGRIVGDRLHPWPGVRELLQRPLVEQAVSMLLRADQTRLQGFGEQYSRHTEVWEDDPENPGARILTSVRCYRCGRTLTVPTSIDRGMGDDCASKDW